MLLMEVPYEEASTKFLITNISPKNERNHICALRALWRSMQRERTNFPHCLPHRLSTFLTAVRKQKVFLYLIYTIDERLAGIHWVEVEQVQGKNVAWIGTFFKKAFRGKKIPCDVTLSFFDNVRQLLSDVTLLALILPENVASQRRLTKCGLKAIGTAEKLRYYNGWLRSTTVLSTNPDDRDLALQSAAQQQEKSAPFYNYITNLLYRIATPVISFASAYL